MMPEQLERIMRNQGFTGRLGIKLETFSENQVTCSLAVQDWMMNPNGVLHGGVIFTLMDSGMGVAVATQLKEGERCTAFQIQVHYLRPAATGKLEAKSSVAHLGEKLGVAESTVFNEYGDLIAKATGSFYISRKKGAV